MRCVFGRAFYLACNGTHHLKDHSLSLRSEYNITIKVLQYTGGGGGGGTISFQSAADGVQLSRTQKFHFQAKARFFNTFMPVSLNIDLDKPCDQSDCKNTSIQKRTVGRKLITTVWEL